MLPDFLFAENKQALPGAGLVLYTRPPFWIGQVYKAESREELEAAIAKHARFAIGKPHGYNVVIIGVGALSDYSPPSVAGEYADALAAIFRRMADFYLEHNILPNESRFKKYRDD